MGIDNNNAGAADLEMVVVSPFIREGNRPLPIGSVFTAGSDAEARRYEPHLAVRRSSRVPAAAGVDGNTLAACHALRDHEWEQAIRNALDAAPFAHAWRDVPTAPEHVGGWLRDLLAAQAAHAAAAVETPVETPPVETPPVETPPVETPPVETPPVETPPVETPGAPTKIVLPNPLPDTVEGLKALAATLPGMPPVRGTGQRGRVLESDLVAAIEAYAANPPQE